MERGREIEKLSEWKWSIKFSSNYELFIDKRLEILGLVRTQEG